MDTTDSWLLVGILAALLLLIWFFVRGTKAFKAMSRVERSVAEGEGDAGIIRRIDYHGGFPAIPKPTRLNLGLCRDAVVLYANDGRNGRVPFEDFRRLDKFSTLRKQEKRRSMFFWAPIALLFVKEKTRHFVAIQYTDIDRDINHIILETKDVGECDRLYQCIHRAWHGFKQCRSV